MTQRRGADAVLFDLDGVLVDTEPWWDEVRRAFATAHGRLWTRDDQRAVMGANSRQWALIMRERLGLADMEPESIETAIVGGVLARYQLAAPPLLPAAVETVRRIALDRRVAIASSSHPVLIRAAIDALDLAGAFGAVVSSDEVSHGKPAPDVYLLAASRLGTEPARCLVVEDSLNGVLAGRAAGMAVVLVPNPSVPPAPGAHELAHLVLERLADLDPDAIGI